MEMLEDIISRILLHITTAQNAASNSTIPNFNTDLYETGIKYGVVIAGLAFGIAIAYLISSARSKSYGNKYYRGYRRSLDSKLYRIYNRIKGIANYF